jgi:mono/diheme cytochrome c family protein
MARMCASLTVVVIRPAPAINRVLALQTGNCGVSRSLHRAMEAIMRLASAFLSLVLLAACVAPAREQSRLEVRGRELAQTNCSSCHAVGASGESPAPEAPSFRTLSQNYRVATLEEALAEGISVGHPAMPQFAFGPEDAHAMVVYLESIQERRRHEPAH